MQTTKLRAALRRFAADRNWEQFHSPKNLAMALSVEAAELLEHFQSPSEEQSRSLPAEALEAEVAECRSICCVWPTCWA